MPPSPTDVQQGIATLEEVKRVSTVIHAAKDIDAIMLDIRKDLTALFGVDDVAIYIMDTDKKDLYTKAQKANAVEEHRVPLNEQSIVGFTAKYLRPLNLADAYDKLELKKIHPLLNHDIARDQKTGFRTKQVLAYPVVAENKFLIAVLYLQNKKSGERFSKQDEQITVEVAKALSLAITNQRKATAKSATKFDYLLMNGKISQPDLDAALQESRKSATDVESLLIDKYKVSKAELGKSLSQYYKCSYVAYDDRIVLDPALTKNINLELCKKNFWLPLKKDKAVTQVLVDDPNNLEKIQDIKRAMPGQNLQFAVSLRRDIQQFIKVAKGEISPLGGASTENISDILGELVSEAAAEAAAEQAAIAGLDENASAIVRLANQVIIEAFRRGASDIHIEPYGEKMETRIRFRVDGSCEEYMKLPPAYRRAIVSRYKIMSSLDIAERRKPQDGKIKFRIGTDREIELRVATIPTAGHNEDIVMRILAASEPLPLEKMGFSERNHKELMAIADKPYGIILCVGPTGSGKTTTLHAVLGTINTPDTKIWTAEDPVEISQYGLRQVQVQPKIGFTFAAAMRAFLRADPDVIMVGEMRDKETAEIAIEASLTGHLVLSTLHTNSAVETITRLLDMGCDSFSFSDAMLGILAQRLARKICADCREDYVASKEEYDDLVRGYGQAAWEKNVKRPYDGNFKLTRGTGCDTCNQSGFKGRVAIHELLVGTDRMKRMIQNKAKTDEMLKVALEEGMTSLVQDGIQKVMQGLTTYKEVRAVALK